MTKHNPPPFPARPGFTLTEVVAVLVVIGILSAIGFTLVRRPDVSLPAEVDQLKSHLRYAQTRAQSDIYPWRLVFIDDQTYEIGPVVIPGAGFTPSLVPGTGTIQRTLGDGVTATPGTVVRFDSWGRPLNDIGVLMANDQTITLTQGDENQSITVLSNTGLIP